MTALPFRSCCLLLAAALSLPSAASAQPLGGVEAFCAETPLAAERVPLAVDGSQDGPLGLPGVVLSYGLAPTVDTFSSPAPRPVAACPSTFSAAPLARAASVRLSGVSAGGTALIGRDVSLVRLSRTLVLSEIGLDWVTRAASGQITGVLVAVSGDVGVVARPTRTDRDAVLAATRRLLAAGDVDILAVGRGAGFEAVVVIGTEAGASIVDAWRVAEPSRSALPVTLLRVPGPFAMVGAHRAGVQQ